MLERRAWWQFLSERHRTSHASAFRLCAVHMKRLAWITDLAVKLKAHLNVKLIANWGAGLMPSLIMQLGATLMMGLSLVGVYLMAHSALSRRTPPVQAQG